jgi:hypothetical protein
LNSEVLHFYREFAEKAGMKWLFLLMGLTLSFKNYAEDKSAASSVSNNLVIYRNQKRSTFDWDNLNPAKFLSYKEWLNTIKEREFVPEWESIMRERAHKEIAGHFFQCVGTCHIDRGESFFNPSLNSSIYEGDEIQTLGDSFAWIFLNDGTMVRLAAESSLTINEFNIGITENFINARVNYGNIVWLSRKNTQYEDSNLRETDVLFNKLTLYEALPIKDKKDYKEDDLFKMLEEPTTISSQYQRLNNMIEENNKMTKGRSTYSFLIMPNVTLMGHNLTGEMVVITGAKSYFKVKSSKALGLKSNDEDKEISVQLRGFENKDIGVAEVDKWMVVDDKGKTMSVETSKNINLLTMGELITKHIPSLMVGRELMMQKFSSVCFIENPTAKLMIEKYDYRLWGSLKSTDANKSDSEQHLDFLKEYFRRIETTNLYVGEHFRERLVKRGELIKQAELSNSYFSTPLHKYYLDEEGKKEADKEEELNSTSKKIWKRMNGIR